MKFAAKFNEIDAVLFEYTPASIAEVAAFAGEAFQGVLAEPNPRGQMVAKVGSVYVTEGYYVYRKRDGKNFSAISKRVFLMLFEPPKVERPAPVAKEAPMMLSLEAALQAAKDRQEPAPVVEAAPVVVVEAAKQEVSRTRAPSVEGYTFVSDGDCLRGHAKQGQLLRYTKGGGCVECSRMKAQAHYYTKRMRETIVTPRGARA